MALLRQMQPLVSIMALGIGLGLIGNSFGTIPTSGSALFGFGATILAGATMGLIGGGGSILTVPILVYLLGIPPVLATGYSLFVVGLSALVGSVNYFKLGLVNLKAGTIFAIPAFVGVFLARKFLVPALPLEIFSVVSLVVGRDLIVMGVFA
ncbi:MAG: TSUP family transporter, partial [bacterium]